VNRILTVATLGASILAARASAHADTPAKPAPFTDSTCPEANDSGRKLNALNVAGNVSGDDLMAAAEGLVAAYKECRMNYDQLVNRTDADHETNSIAVGRIYSRLQLARSYQRIGYYREQLHYPAEAKVQYDLALEPLAQIEQIMEGSRVGIADRESAEFKLQAQEQALHTQIVASEAKLPTPAPAPSTVTK
jgi:hypothetical protein